jgi:ParB family chromosome partitioning protein
MRIIDIDLSQLNPAPWNPNKMEPGDLAHLKKSLQLYGLIQNLVVRPLSNNHDKVSYEVLSGNQRLRVLQEMKVSPVSCVVVNLDDVQARLLAQALNHLHGTDDLGLRAEVLREVLKTIPEVDVLSLLPETKGSLAALASMNQENIETYLKNWQHAQKAKLKHLQFQLIPNQIDIVEEALTQVLPVVKQEKRDNPNQRGVALYLICKFYLENKKHE